MTGTQPFKKPWRIEERGESIQIIDANGVQLAFIYFEDEPTRRNLTRRLSKYDALRMAKQILRLPELIQIERDFKNQA